MADFTRAVDWARRLVADGRLPSAVVGVATVEGVQVLEGFGAAPDDGYALFSVTKPLVALTAARQFEAGTLTPRTPLARALPGWGGGRYGAPVRLEHLLGHTSGVRDVGLGDAGDRRAALRDAGQEFGAGTAQRYCNLAFEGVAALVEQAGAAPVAEQLERLCEGWTTAPPSFDAPYLPVQGAQRLGLDVPGMLSRAHPGAGLCGTAQGLLDLGGALVRVLRDGGDGPVGRAALQAMLRPTGAGLPEPVPEAERRHFGLGWHLRPGSRGLLDDDAFGHAGWSGTQWWMWPRLGLTVVLLTNLLDLPHHGVDPDELCNAAVAGATAGGGEHGHRAVAQVLP